MKRSFSIGLATVLGVLLHLPQAQASYTSHAWVKISNITLTNATWNESSTSCSGSPAASSDAWAEIGNMDYRWSHSSPVQADLVTSDSASCANATASASTSGDGASAEAWAGPASLGTCSWSEGYALLQRQFITPETGGTVTVKLDFVYDYGLETSVSSGGWIQAGITLWGGSTVPAVHWSESTSASGRDYETMVLSRSYQAREIGGLYLYADAHAWAASCPCTCVPAPGAVALGMVGAAAVVVLRRRRVI